MSEIELKPCPFCGGSAFMVQEGTHAQCLTPGCCIGPVSGVDSWNARTSQWQPIETAPKDGTEILAWDGHGQATIHWSNGRWSLVYAGWRAEDGDFDGAISWQPLPAAPEVSK